MTLFEKSLNVLELPQVLEMLAFEAASDAAKADALSLRPDSDIHRAAEKIDEVTAAKDMMVLKGSPSFSGLRDILPSLWRSKKGGMLNNTELLQVAGVLRCAREAIGYASSDDRGNNKISYLFSALRSDRTLEDKITLSILNEDEIADGASAELSDIRRHMKIVSEKVRQSLQKIISSPAGHLYGAPS